MPLPEHLDPTQMSGDWDEEALRLSRKLHADLLKCRPEQVINTMHLALLEAMRFSTGERGLANERISQFVRDNLDRVWHRRESEKLQKKLS